MTVDPETLRQLDLTLELAEAMSGADYDRWDELIRTLPDLIYVAQASSTMLGQMVREDAARTGLPLDEVWANIRRAVLIAAGG